MELAIILVIIIILLVSFFVANRFYEIACMKGHYDRAFFWYTFLLFPIGALMVIALPDRKVSVASVQVPFSSKVSKSAHEKVVPDKLTATFDVPAGSKTTEQPIAHVEQTDDMMTCSLCGCVQKTGRRICWSCGAKFVQDEDQ